MSGGIATPGLNAGQRAIVDRLQGPVFVSAGAGSGKTRVLAERFVALVLSQPEELRSAALHGILLTTFTEKAAGELAERVRRLLIERGEPALARRVDEAWISTIHGFCARLVRRHALELGIDPAFRVLADPQTGVLRTRAFEQAAAELSSADTEVAELLERHSVSTVRAAAIQALDQIRSMGGCARDIVTPRDPQLAAELARLVADMPAIRRAHADLRPLAIVRSNQEALAALEPLLEHASEQAAPLVAKTIVEACGRHRLRPPGSMGGIERDVTLEAIGRVGSLLECAVAEVSSRDAAAFVRVVIAYADAYDEIKAGMSSLDFEDLQLNAVRVLSEDPARASRCAERFFSVMVDEFQDTNALQLRVLEPVAGDELCVVGDDKQSIYGFRHADVAIFEQRRARSALEAPESLHALTTNYRSHPRLLSALNELFDSPAFFDGRHLRLEAGRRDGWRLPLPTDAPRIEALLVETAGWSGGHWREMEALVLARRIRELVDEGVRPSDVVVLVRQMTTVGPYVEALRSVGLDVVARSSGGFLSAPEVRDMRALLRTVANPRDGEAVVGLLAGGLGGLSDDALTRLAIAGQRCGGVWRAVVSAGEHLRDGVDLDRCRLVARVVETMRDTRLAEPLGDRLLRAASELGAGGPQARAGAWDNMRKLARIADELDEAGGADAAGLLRHLAEREAYVRSDPEATSATESSAVGVMTVHAAKGLEFPIVAVADLGHGRPPAHPSLLTVKYGDSLRAVARMPLSMGDKLPKPAAYAEAVDALESARIAEEARLFYVACTRAEELLILTGGCDVEAVGQGERPLDRFLRACSGDRVPGVAVTVVDSSLEEELLTERGVGHRDLEDAGTDIAPQPDLPAAIRQVDPEPIALPPELSYTALALYKLCPRRFLAERLLGLTTRPDTGATTPLDLGQAVHASLRLVALGERLDPERLRAVIRQYRLDEAAGRRLLAAVEGFLASDASAWAERKDARPEVDFQMRIGSRMLTGTLDLLVREGASSVVLDYKTGTADLAEDEARRRFQAQAEIYGLAVLRDDDAAAEIRFVELERGGRQTVFRFTRDDAERLFAEVESVVERIEARDFRPLGAYDHRACGDCPIRGSLCSGAAG